MIQPNDPFAEVIESSLPTWRAQCWAWDIIPAHGSILATHSGNRTIYGIVYAITTGPLDTQRTVFPYKKTEEELKRDHPHIFEFLASTVSCITLGYADHSDIRYQMAPIPPKIHAFVTLPTKQELQAFFSEHGYLHTLFAQADQVTSLDDLLIALVEHMAQTHNLTPERFSRFIQTFSLLTANDYRRLKLFIQRIQPLITAQKICLDL